MMMSSQELENSFVKLNNSFDLLRGSNNIIGGKKKGSRRNSQRLASSFNLRRKRVRGFRTSFKSHGKKVRGFDLCSKKRDFAKSWQRLSNN